MSRKRSLGATKQKGFTLLQMIITIAIIAIVTTFGVLGMRTARAQFRLQNSARLFASYLEKARADSIRRHATAGNEASVETFDAGSNTFRVTMDFGSGTVETRTFQLEPGVTIETAAYTTTFDWRGRITKFYVYQIYNKSIEESIPVDVSGSGDVTVDEQHFPDQLIPAIEISQVTGDVIPDPTPNPSSSPGASPTPSPSGSPGASPTPTPTPTPTPIPTPSVDPSATPTPLPPCTATLSSSSLSLSQSDSAHKTGTVTLTLANATGSYNISANQAGNGNSMNISVTPSRLDGNGLSTISVTAKNGSGNRGVFVINVSTSPTCGSTHQLTVSVSN